MKYLHSTEKKERLRWSSMLRSRVAESRFIFWPPSIRNPCPFCSATPPPCQECQCSCGLPTGDKLLCTQQIVVSGSPLLGKEGLLLKTVRKWKIYPRTYIKAKTGKKSKSAQSRVEADLGDPSPRPSHSWKRGENVWHPPTQPYSKMPSGKMPRCWARKAKWAWKITWLIMTNQLRITTIYSAEKSCCQT